VHSETRTYANVCTPPCAGRLTVGWHRLALKVRDSKPVEASANIEGPSLVHGHYESYSGTRLAGLFTFLGSLGLGTYLMARALTSDATDVPTNCYDGICTHDQKINAVEMGIGAGIFVIGGIVGAVMLLKKDVVSFTVTPLTVGSPRVEGRALWGRADGLALTARW
jgi:hypothetical protein